MAGATHEMNAGGKLASLLEANSEKLLTCVHCGLCLPACPTYRALGDENDSPRGRIYLMRGLVEGKLERGDAFVNHIDLCLGCRACESVCPSGVPYGHLLESARVDAARLKSGRRTLVDRITGVALTHVFTRPALLAALMSIARWFRDSGLARLALETRLVGGRLRFGLALLLASRSPISTRHRNLGPEANGSPRADAAAPPLRVALLRGCVMEGLFRETNRATERVLARNGVEVVGVSGQKCCGALHAHAGLIDAAKELAKANITAFLDTGCDRIVVNAAGCGAAMKEYGSLLSGDADFAGKATAFSSRVRDISEFLAESGFDAPSIRIDRAVCYDAPCHLIHAQRISQAPVDILSSIPGIRLVPLRGADVCCGGAGIYNLQHPGLSREVLAQKLCSIAESGAELIATGNPGCIMQIGAGLLLDGIAAGVVHPVELLDAAYAGGDLDSQL
ncbi:MAG TPA: heterodisulfide reductase-related iron-sulfur binding cluster [Blastocatellia bacterium]|nr:heterodisulfide reductase-related iron-sulfur binding cluster [Blastocatellia bacterium]